LITGIAQVVFAAKLFLLLLSQKGLKGKCSCSKNKEKKKHWLDYAVDDYGVSVTVTSILMY